QCTDALHVASPSLTLMLLSCHSSSLTFFFYCYVDHRDLHSFPTRRSSDLVEHDRAVFHSAADRPNLVHGPAQSHRAIPADAPVRDRKSTRLNSSHRTISYAVFCLKKKKNILNSSYNKIAF